MKCKEGCQGCLELARVKAELEDARQHLAEFHIERLQLRSLVAALRLRLGHGG